MKIVTKIIIAALIICTGFGGFLSGYLLKENAVNLPEEGLYCQNVWRTFEITEEYASNMIFVPPLPDDTSFSFINEDGSLHVFGKLFMLDEDLEPYEKYNIRYTYSFMSVLCDENNQPYFTVMAENVKILERR